MSNSLKEAHSRLESVVTQKPLFDPEIKLHRLRLGVPLVRKSLKPFYSFISDSRKSTLDAWNEVWNLSNFFEAKSQALYFYQYKSINLAEFKVITSWVNTCTCWEHSDDLSKIIATFTEENPQRTLPILKKWVKSKNSWHRRQSLVGLIEYARKRERFLPFDTYIENIDSLLSDSDYYVQKAVGWTLREVYNIYPEKCLQYQKEKIAELSSLAYSTATEKLNSREKEQLNQMRKKKG